jgi:hypothetical protein
MATTISAEQTEKAFQKQPIFQNSKIKSAGKKVASKDRRWYKDVGLGFKVSEIQLLRLKNSRCLFGIGKSDATHLQNDEDPNSCSSLPAEKPTIDIPHDY